MHLKIKLAALALVSAAATTHAEVRSFWFSGTVDYSLPMAPAGTVITGTFSYDLGTEPDYTSGDPCGPGYGNSAYAFQHSFSATVNGHTITSAPVYTEVVNNFGGNVEDVLTVYGQPMTLDGTSFPEGLIGFQLASGPGNTEVFRCTRMPRGIHLKRFDSGNYGWRSGWIMTDGGPNGMLLTFVVDRVVSLRGNIPDDE